MQIRTILIATAAAVGACDGESGNVAQIDQNGQSENLAAGPGAAAPAAALVAADGTVIGEVTRGDGGTAAEILLTAQGLPPGVHGIHLHDVGLCEGPGFDSAGPHWNPTSAMHGSENPAGPHLGDLPNLTVGADGTARLTLPVPAELVDEDGAALVIHADPDDNRTDPSGNSGARIACAAITG